MYECPGFDVEICFRHPSVTIRYGGPCCPKQSDTTIQNDGFAGDISNAFHVCPLITVAVGSVDHKRMHIVSTENGISWAAADIASKCGLWRHVLPETLPPESLRAAVTVHIPSGYRGYV